MIEDDPFQKETLPGQEAASSNSSLRKKRLSARDRHEIKRLKRRITNNYQAVLPTWLLNSRYHASIGPALWLLLLIIRGCDWTSGELKSTKGAFAFWLGVDSRTIKNYLNSLKEIGVQHERGYGSDLYIFLPDNLIPGKYFPSKPGRKKILTPPQELSGNKENGFVQKRKHVSGIQSIGELIERLDKRQ